MTDISNNPNPSTITTIEYIMPNRYSQDQTPAKEKIGDTEIADFFKLKDLTNMEYFDLNFRKNLLTDISSVENLVKENPLMKDIYLDLEYNDISDLSPLEDFLDSNTDIKYIRLYLDGNPNLSDLVPLTKMCKNLTELTEITIYLRDISSSTDFSVLNNVVQSLPNQHTMSRIYFRTDNCSSDVDMTIAQIGYYSDGRCYECPVDCQKCLNPTVCEVCKPGKIINGSVCDTCNAKCKTCGPDKDTCLTCVDDTREGPDCKCRTGLYSTVTDGVCDQICNFSCNTCQEITGQCIDCADSNRNPADNCSCIPGYYEQNPQNSTCGQCDNSQCGTCELDGSLNIVCIQACNEGCVSCNVDGSCIGTVCKPKYFYQISDSSCQKCNDKCLDCSGDQDNCGNCVNPAYTAPLCELQCTGATYKELEQCKPCKQGCTLCDSYENCTECESNREGITCSCILGFYENSTNNQCESCDNSVCGTCEEDGMGEVVCIRGCDEGCVSCNVDGSCMGSECKMGYFQNAGSCVKCNENCQQCEDSPGNCTVCKDLSAGTPNCNFQCLEGSYRDQGECKNCKKGCKSCVNQNICFECTEPNRENILCLCKEGYFENQITFQCENCSPLCKTCHSEDTCSSCREDQFRKLDQNTQKCVCMEGYYQDNDEICKRCPAYCKTCSSFDQCTSCQIQTFQPPTCYFRGYSFFSQINQNPLQVSLQKCNRLCSLCSVQGSCLECKVAKNRNVQPPCKCLAGYHDQNELVMDCIQCPSTCLECINAQQCKSCKKGLNREIDSVTGKCDCKIGFTEDGDDGKDECVRCVYYKGECVRQCPRNTIFREQGNECVDRVFNLEDRYYLFYVCLSLVLITLFGSFGFYNVKKKINQVPPILSEQQHISVKSQEANQ